MTNVERQRQFQKRNPGYDARRKATQRALEKAETERLKLTQQTALTAREPLMLPAPVELIVFPWTVEQVRQRAAAEQREAVFVER